MAGEKKRSEAETRKILEEARARFKRCQDWEATFRPRFLEDIKFDAGDARNNYQWDADYVTARGNRPSLTINRTRQHNLDILNDARQSKVAVKVRPLREGASYDSAQILDGIIKHIEYISNADSAYQIALGFAVRGGIGWIRLVTDYTGDDTFDQEIFIRPVKNPLSVMIDPDISEFDGSDALFGFVFTDMPKAEFDKAYPKYKDMASSDDLSPSDSWILDGDRVRIAEYFRCVKDEDTLVAYQDPTTGQQVTKRRSELDKALLAQIVDDPSMAERTVVMTKVEHFKIIGDQIAEEKVWPGKYIPLLRCVGEETIIDGQMDRKGHTRALLDMQRSLNYNAPLALDTVLPTPTGWTTMAEVRPGDALLDENGFPAIVDGISPTFLFRDCYSVEFDDGTHIVADAQHLWTVDERQGSSPVSTSWKTKTISTDKLTPHKHYIFTAKPLELPEVPLPVHPYVLGVWLGNGRATGSGITSHVDDAEETRALLGACGYHVSEARHYKNKAGAADYTVFGLMTELRKLGVLGNKHIPDAYLRASREQREALLQGLMDTDGNISEKRQCSFINSNPFLADGFAELLRTLGIKAVSQDIPEAVRMFPDGQMRTARPARRFAFSAGPEVPVFRISRKAMHQAAPRPVHPRRTKRHRIVSVTPVPWVPVKCLAINSETHLFLAGPGMVPTHNSASIEYGALQTKTPYTAPAKAIEGYEEYWKTANTENFSVLPWNHVDDDGNPIPKPERIEPPAAAPVFVQGARDAVEWMYLASGQNQADFGQPSNEKSGVAIEARQRQGDNATYHYLDHQAIMIRYLGKQLVDLIGKVYDTPRLVPYRDDAGNEGQVQIDPEAQQHFQQEKNPDDGATTSIMNPKMGVYDVQADVGPAYATRRAEAFAAFSQLLAANKELFALVGDIWMRFSDVPGAEEASERLKRMVPSQAMHDGPAPDVLHLQGQLKEAQGLIQSLSQKLEDKSEKNAYEGEKNAIKAYDSVTGRVKALEKALGLDPDGLLVLVREVIEEAQFQSAGGGALEHAAEPTPQIDQIHPGMGGQLQAPAPHVPPLDPNQSQPTAEGE